MIGNPHADGVAFRMQQAARHFSRRLEDKSITAGRARLEQPVFAIIEFRITGNFGQIAAHQGKVMVFTHLTNGANACHDVLVAQLAPQRITRIGRVSDDTPGAYDSCRLPYQAQLGIIRDEWKRIEPREKQFLIIVLRDLKYRMLQAGSFPTEMKIRPDSALDVAMLRWWIRYWLPIRLSFPVVPYRLANQAMAASGPDRNSSRPGHENPSRAKPTIPAAGYGAQTAWTVPAYGWR